MQLSPAERERRSQQARRQHAEGSLGSRAVATKAAQRSAEVRSTRASSIARRLLEEHEDEIRKTLLEIIAKGTRSERLKAIDTMIKAGLRGEAAGLAERKVEGEMRSREELLEAVVSKLTAATPSAALMRNALAERGVVIDGQAIELP